MGWRAAAAVGASMGLLLGCATRGPPAAIARAEPAPAREHGIDRRYVDPVFGFELVRPMGSWSMEVNEERSPEGLAVPLVLHDGDSGAQVVVQIAPAIATPSEFADRLASGLRRHEGFVAEDPVPLAMGEGAVGFDFSLGDAVLGRVAVIEGSPGNVFMLMATWPSSSPQAAGGIDQLFKSVRPVPQG